MEKESAILNDEKRVLHLLGISNQKASHIRLVKGVVRVNPHVKDLCPTLAKGEVCHRGGKHPQEWYRPKLLVKNFNDSRIQLWSCEGCKAQFLIRVILPKIFNPKTQTQKFKRSSYVNIYSSSFLIMFYLSFA